MRKLMFVLLLAGAAAPALAADRDGERRSVFREHRGDGEKSSSDKPRREAPVARAPRSDGDGPARASGGGNVEMPRAERAERRGAGDTVRNWRQGSDQAFEQRARKVEGPRETLPHRPVGAVWGTEPPAPRTAGTWRANPDRRWSGEWRHDRRYDWRDYRRHHRDRFHFGFYYDPFGWDYFRYGIGWRMWPSYYRSSYWLNDPWEYRLPPAYGPYRWIRYHNDALLVNIYTGEVVDVEYDFFW